MVAVDLVEKSVSPLIQPEKKNKETSHINLKKGHKYDTFILIPVGSATVVGMALQPSTENAQHEIEGHVKTENGEPPADA